MNFHIENVTVDYFRFGFFYHSYIMYWNYPEANIYPVLNFKNIIVENSNIEHTGTQLDVIRSGDPGNITVENLDLTKWFLQSTAIAGGISFQIIPICIPTDGVQQYFSTTNMSSSLLGNERK